MGLLGPSWPGLALDANGATETTLVLDQAEQSFVFENIGTSPCLAAARVLGPGGAGRRPVRCRPVGAAAA